MLRIKASTRQAIIDLAITDAPIEVCGLILGETYCGSSNDRLIQMDNIAEEWGTSFEFDPEQQLAVWNDMESRGEVPVAIYHSHTKHSAQPSNRDEDGAVLSATHYIIVSVLDSDNPVFKSYAKRGGRLIEEEIEVIS